mmetsp:Transcript_2135/g.6430  ORF Transcript_2135/g.6430 Transcript_2135/m.6430 type:complete len:86 (+) Transcript_2135:1-258(+)
MAGLLAVSAVGFVLAVRDAWIAHEGAALAPWATALVATVASSGVRVIRVFAVIGCVVSARELYHHVQVRARLLLVRWGVRVLNSK